MLLYIIRHGEPDYKTDTLTETGVKQAEILSRRFADVKFDKIFSSPLGRAKQTAMPTCVKQNKNFEELPWLSENLAYNAMSAQIDEKKDWWYSVQNTKYRTEDDAKKRQTDQTIICYESITCEFDNFLFEHGYKKDGSVYEIIKENNDRIAFFCHDGISKILLSYALLIPFYIFCGSFSISYTGVSILEFASNGDKLTSPRCLTLSDFSHLSGIRNALSTNGN